MGTAGTCAGHLPTCRGLSVRQAADHGMGARHVAFRRLGERHVTFQDDFVLYGYYFYHFARAKTSTAMTFQDEATQALDGGIS